MIKKKDFEKINCKKYSVKEAFAYYVMGFRNVKNENYKSVFMEVIENIHNIPNKNEALEQIKDIDISAIENNWNLSLQQVVAYAYIIFDSLIKSYKKFSEHDILWQFECAMKLYSPNNAVEFFEKKLYELNVEN